MDIFQQHIHAVSVFNSFVLGLLMLMQKGSGFPARVLAFWCFSLSLYSLTPLLLINDIPVVFQTMSVVTLWLPATFAPLLFVYLDGLTKQRAFKLTDLLHFLPFVVCILLNAENIHWSLQHLDEFRRLGTPKVATHTIAQTIVYVQAMVYVLLCARLIFTYQKLAESKLSTYDNSVFNHLIVIWFINFLTWTFEIFSSLLGGVYLLSLAADILLLGFISVLALLHWKAPEYLLIKELKQSPLFSSGVSPKQEISGQENWLDLNNDVAKLMDNEQLFLDPNLSLELMSDKIGVSRHVLSEFLNKQLNKNFHRFVNEYRIEYLCEQLKQTGQETKLLDIAMQSGFSSKSTFNYVFKQYTGMTPSQYRHSME